MIDIILFLGEVLFTLSPALAVITIFAVPVVLSFAREQEKKLGDLTFFTVLLSAFSFVGLSVAYVVSSTKEVQGVNETLFGVVGILSIIAAAVVASDVYQAHLHRND